MANNLGNYNKHVNHTVRIFCQQQFKFCLTYLFDQVSKESTVNLFLKINISPKCSQFLCYNHCCPSERR